MLTDLSSISPTDLSGLFNIAPFNPMDLVTQSSNNMMTQLQAATNVRKQLDSIRGDVALNIANLDLSAMKSYATDTLSHSQDMFVTGFTAPALTQIAPETVTNPLSSDLLGGLTGELTATSLTEGLFNEGTDLLSGSGLSNIAGSADNLLSSGLGDLAVSGAGMYVSAMTGGVVPPTVASAVVRTAADAGLGIVQGESPSLASIGSDLAGNVVSGYTGGILGGSAISGALGEGTGLSTTLASSINGLQLGSNSMTSVLGETTASSIFSDVTGGTFEGITDKVMDKVGSSVVSAASGNSFFDFGTITSAAESFTKSVAGDIIDTVGGINLKDPSSIADGIITKGLDVAKDAGDVSTFSKLLDNFSKDKGIFSTDVIDLAENMINNPYNLSNYTDLVDDVGIDFGEIISKGASYGCSAVREATEIGGFDKEEIDRASSLLSSALDSKLFNKLKTVGDRVAQEVLDYDTYRQLDALSDVADVISSSKGGSNSYNSGRRNYRKLSRATEYIFNNGRTFGNNTGPSWRFDIDITNAIDEARWILR